MERKKVNVWTMFTQISVRPSQTCDPLKLTNTNVSHKFENKDITFDGLINFIMAHYLCIKTLQEYKLPTTS